MSRPLFYIDNTLQVYENSKLIQYVCLVAVLRDSGPRAREHRGGSARLHLSERHLHGLHRRIRAV